MFLCGRTSLFLPVSSPQQHLDGRWMSEQVARVHLYFWVVATQDGSGHVIPHSLEGGGQGDCIM